MFCHHTLGFVWKTGNGDTVSKSRDNNKNRNASGVKGSYGVVGRRKTISLPQAGVSLSLVVVLVVDGDNVTGKRHSKTISSCNLLKCILLPLPKEWLNFSA